MLLFVQIFGVGLVHPNEITNKPIKIYMACKQWKSMLQLESKEENGFCCIVQVNGVRFETHPRCKSIEMDVIYFGPRSYNHPKIFLLD